MTKKLLVLAMVILPPVCNSAVAQENDYMMEIGLGGGGSFYMGDANTRLYNNTNGVFSVLARYNVNPRFSLKADLAQ